jgi:hypothetical protein
MRKIGAYCFSAMFLLLFTFAPICTVCAESEGLILKAQQPWETYGNGSTCISGSSNLFVYDIDNDGVTEIVTGGSMYQIVNQTRTVVQAPLMIWNWDGKNVTLELSYKWPGSLRAISAADLDNDGIVELITAGTYRNETGSVNTLRIWNWDNTELVLKAQFDDKAVSAMFVADLDKDGVPELLTVGRLVKDNKTTAQMTTWQYSNGLNVVQRVDLDVANVTNANSIAAIDLDGNGDIEIVVGGYSDSLNNSKGQVTVWNWVDNNFVLKANREWQFGGEGYALTIAGGVQGNTIVNNVKAADINQDGKDELVVGGFTWDGEDVLAQIKVFAWDGLSLAELDSVEWAGDYLTEVKCLYLFDVDNDGVNEVISSGTIAAAGSFKNASSSPDRGQLRIWALTDGKLTLKIDTVWSLEDGVCAWNVVAFNLGGVPQIVTVGCLGVGGLCDPNMRIWELPQSNNNYNIIIVIAAVLATATILTTLMIIRKKASNTKKAL